MNHAYAKDVYRNNQVTTAPQKKLIIMLYDGAIRNLKLAEIAMENKDIEKINTHLIKAQDIIMELMTTLNFEAGGDIAKNLYQLYDYMFFRLVRANIDKNIDYVKEVKKYMEELRDAWEQI
jgi:flagellar protein FliS